MPLEDPSFNELDPQQIILLHYLEKKLKEYKPGDKMIDLSTEGRFWYTGSDVAGHFARIQSKDYRGLEKIISLAGEKIPREKVSIADYGCGGGEKGIHIYKILKATGELYLIDYSKEMIAKALKHARNKEIPAKEFEIDLTKAHDLFKREDDPNPRFHLFLGQTIGNFKPPQDEDVINAIVSSMRKDEYLLVEWFSEKIRDTEEDKNWLIRILNGYCISSEYVTNGSGKLDFFLDKESDPQWDLAGFRLQKEFPHKGTGITLPSEIELIIARSRRFEEKEIISLFERQGLEAQIVERIREQQWIEPIPAVDYFPEKAHYEETEVLKRWIEQGVYRYALFKEVRDKTKRRNKLIVPAAILAAGLAVGGYILSDSVSCEQATMNGLFGVECFIDGKKKEFKLYDFDNPRIVEERGKATIEGEYDQINYTFKLRLGEKTKEIRENLDRLNIIRRRAEEIRPRCNVPGLPDTIEKKAICKGYTDPIFELEEIKAFYQKRIGSPHVNDLVLQIIYSRIEREMEKDNAELLSLLMRTLRTERIPDILKNSELAYFFHRQPSRAIEVISKIATTMLSHDVPLIKETLTLFEKYKDSGQLTTLSQILSNYKIFREDELAKRAIIFANKLGVQVEAVHVLNHLGQLSEAAYRIDKPSGRVTRDYLLPILDGLEEHLNHQQINQSTKNIDTIVLAILDSATMIHLSKTKEKYLTRTFEIDLNFLPDAAFLVGAMRVDCVRKAVYELQKKGLYPKDMDMSEDQWGMLWGQYKSFLDNVIKTVKLLVFGKDQNRNYMITDAVRRSFSNLAFRKLMEVGPYESGLCR